MRIALLGDVALIGRYDRTKSDNVEERVSVVKELVKNCDYVIGNLESPLTSITKTKACKGVYLRSDPVNVETLAYMGVTHVTLANNHTFDYGQKAAEESINTLEKAGIRIVGLNHAPERLVKDDSSALLEGFCCLSANALNYGNHEGQVHILTPETMKVFLEKAKQEHALGIASVHFGLEGLHYPALEHMNLFRGLAKEYNYVLHGNHPHAIQGYETINHSLLIYAQGNLCFDATPVNSVHITGKRGSEERKSYISILDIRGADLISHEIRALTDLETDILHESQQIVHELDGYTQALSLPMPEILAKRKAELNAQQSLAAKRNIKFYLNRLNRKYIGAYLNGRKHAKAYSIVLGPYMKERE